MATQYINFRVSTSQPNVDVNNRQISNVIIASIGEAEGHGFSVDDDFLDDLVAFATKDLKNKAKSNFGHNYNNLGKQVGNVTSFRREGDSVFGDLTILKSADNSPIMPNMGNYLLELAGEDSSSVMLSIRFKEDYFFQNDGKGKKIKIWYYNQDGRWIMPIDDLGKIFVKFKTLKSVDLVDNGALTDTLFSSTQAIHQFQDLINTPEFPQLLETHYQDFRVLNDFYSNKNQSTLGKLFTEFKQIMSGDNTDLNKLQEKYDALQKNLNASKESILGLKARLEVASKSDDSDTTDLQSKLDLATKKATDLQTDLDAKNTQITELEKGASTSHTSDDGEGDEGTTDLNAEPWLKDDINQRAMSTYGDA